jgi:cell division protease FtsH
MCASFAQAREKTAVAGGAILFIDEVDSFPNRETLTHHYKDYEIQVVNALLAEIDGVEGRRGVVLLAACNHPHLLDPALVRSGRLDRHIRISLPDQAALARILREHLGKDFGGESLQEAALAAAGASGADCEPFVRGARRRARGR